VVVSALRQLGYTAQFAPPLAGRVLDAVCTVGLIDVYFEVVAPELADASRAERQLIAQLSDAVRSAVSRCRGELELFEELSPVDFGGIIEAIQNAGSSNWVFLGEKLRFRRIDKGQPLLPTFDGDGAQNTFGGESSVQGDLTGVIIRRETTDQRAKRVFNAEYHQFSDSVPNVLVIDVCAVSEGMKEWPAVIARLLQPGRNRKVGAMLFVDQGVLVPPEAIRRRWRVLLNPHAHLRIPDVLLNDLESLDESGAPWS
jgi:hypothetical protein